MESETKNDEWTEMRPFIHPIPKISSIEKLLVIDNNFFFSHFAIKTAFLGILLTPVRIVISIIFFFFLYLFCKILIFGIELNSDRASLGG
jgi:hypothetical protein